MGKRTIDARAIMDDIRSGLGDIPIMEKYHLSPDHYRIVKTKLSNKSFPSINQAKIRNGSNHDIAKGCRRARPRGHLLYCVTVQDAQKLYTYGILNDITERGLQTSGLPTRVGETRSLLIGLDDYFRAPPILLEATCQWVELYNGKPLAGFHITKICQEDLRTLKRIVDELAVIGTR